MKDLISRQAAIDAITDENIIRNMDSVVDSEMHRVKRSIHRIIASMPSAQPEIVRCKDCEYGEQDEVGRWFCRSLGCQIGSEDGSGFCADAERRTDERSD